MAKANVPRQVPDEPHESAYQPQVEKGNSRSKRVITFAEDSELSQRIDSQKSDGTYKDALSQPASGISHRDKLLWLQLRRAPGLWVQCDSCNRWRHLSHILDKHELPDQWFCKMNPDESVADCSVPESRLRITEEEDLIHSEYSAGSVVWAQLGGWPWWPALVVDCPDTEQYYWLDGFSDIPTHYNVVFFDAFEVTRAWITPEKLMPFDANIKELKSKDRKFKSRLEVAMKQANDATNLSIQERLSKYSFIARYKGRINSPLKVNRTDLLRYQKQLKRKYNIEFPMESDSDSDQHNDLPSIEKKDQKSKKKTKNSHLKRRLAEDNLNNLQSDCSLTDSNEVQNNFLENNKNTESTDYFKHPSSMVVQVGSSNLATQKEQSNNETLENDNDTSTTYAVGSEDLRASVPSPRSDDFEF